MSAPDKQRVSPLTLSGGVNTSKVGSEVGIAREHRGSHKNTQSNISQQLNSGPFPYNKSYSHLTDGQDDLLSKRKSFEVNLDEEETIMRLYSQGLFKQNASRPPKNAPTLSIGAGVGTTQDYALISEEDLLSNMDRHSRLAMH